jgi:DNA-binding transcriptional regulator YiaG
MTPKQVRDAREELGLTQSQLGEALQLDGDNVDRTVRRWESGKSPITGPAATALWLYRHTNKRPPWWPI